MFEKILKRLAVFARFGLMAAVAVALLAGCGDDRLVSDSSDSDHDDDPFWNENLDINRFMYEISSDTLAVNHSVTVSGWVIDSLDNPVPNVILYYSAEPVNMGYFSKSVDTTRLDGSFSSSYLPINTGEVILTVEVSDNKLINASRTFTVSDAADIDDPGVLYGYSFDWSVPEGLVLGVGEDNTLEIGVTIHMDNETPAPNGTVVKLEAGERFDDLNGDGYFTENVDEVTHDANDNEIWDKIGSVPAVVTTTDSVATFTYTAGTQSGLVFIRATVGEPEDEMFGELALALRPNADVSFIKMSAASSEIQVKATGGIEATNLTAYCYDKYGNPVQQDIAIDFEILSGPNGGENIEEQGYGPVSANTNVVGAATVSLLSGTISGTIATQARVGDVYSDVILVNVNAGPPDEISIGVDPCNVLGCEYVNNTADLIVLVEDRYSNPVMDSTVVYFTIDESVYNVGMIDAYDITINGLASTTFRTTGKCIDVCCPVIVETDGGRISDTTCFWVSGAPGSVDIFSYPSSLEADGKSKGKVFAEVLDVNGIFVLNGTEVEFEFWPEGSIEDGTTSDGCHASVAETELVSAVLSKDYSYSIPDDGIGAYGVITASVGPGLGISNTAGVILTTGYTYPEQSEVKVASKIAPGSSEPLTIVIKDRFGNPLSGHLLTAEPSVGYISVNDGNLMDIDSAYTDQYGECTALRYYAPDSVGNAYIIVSDSDPRGGMIITKKIEIQSEE